MSSIDIDYELIKSERRKTLGLQVKKGKVILRAPYFVSDDHISQFIQAKSNWLKAKINQQIAHLDQDTLSEPYREGSLVFVAGEQKTLSIVYTGKAPIKLRDSLLIISLPTYLMDQKTKRERAIKKQLELWFKAVANEYIPSRLIRLSKETGLSYTHFKIKKYKARWGSCNSRGELSFNYLLLMTPNWVIDYVIIHELCHLKHLNHSKDFWQLVAQHCPQYTQAKHWLKQHQDQLSLP